MRRNGLTIGIPVYNEEDRVAHAIRSAAHQCERLIVADNASTDRTETVCRSLLREFPNMEYIRHARNLGAKGNWVHILGMTATPYLMFLGSHDHIDGNFTDTVLPALVNDTTVEVATGELYFDYGTRTEQVAAYCNWAGGMQESPRARVCSFLYDRAPLVWGAYGIYRTVTFRRWFTDALPVYGIDVIFLARILKAGRFRIVHGAGYHAWVKSGNEAKSAYLERVVARKHASGERLALRNEFRLAQHDAIAEFYPAASPWKRLALRYRSMVRFGMFRTAGTDPLFYLLYLPVKLARKLERLARRTRRGA